MLDFRVDVIQRHILQTISVRFFPQGEKCIQSILAGRTRDRSCDFKRDPAYLILAFYCVMHFAATLHSLSQKAILYV